MSQQTHKIASHLCVGSVLLQFMRDSPHQSHGCKHNRSTNAYKCDTQPEELRCREHAKPGHDIQWSWDLAYQDAKEKTALGNTARERYFPLHHFLKTLSLFYVFLTH